MKIMVLSTVRYRTNGISTVIRNLYANQAFTKEKVTFVFPNDSEEDMVNELLTFGYEVFQINGRNGHPFKYIKSLMHLMKEQEIELVHIHGNSNTCAVEMLAAKRAGVPVRIMHSHSVDCVHKTLNKLMESTLNSLVTARFACSEAAGKYLFGERPFTVIKNALKIEEYRADAAKRAELRTQYGLIDRTVLGHVGTFSILKNQTFLVDVLAEYKKHNGNAVLVLVGDGAEKPHVEAKVKAMGLADSVIFTGARNDIPVLLNMFDYFVFPSLSEGFGIAPIEAQANGLPVIASKDRIVPEVCINPNFRFVPLEAGATEWSRHLLELSPQRYEDATENVRSAGFELADEVERLKQIYENLLNTEKTSQCK